MHQGNWKCSSCGGTITELPFEPRSESGLTCRTCYAKQKNEESQQAPETPSADEDKSEMPVDAGLAGEPAPMEDTGSPVASGSTGERQKFLGNWKCADCDADITSLPFEPRNTSGLKCIDCFKKSKA